MTDAHGPAAAHEPAGTPDLADVVRAARAEGRGLKVVGAGKWSGEGTPAARVRDGADQVTLRRLSGIVAYVPGDLTLTARAGTTLAELDDATRAHGQWCPLCPWGTDDGTIGATFATATTGPFGAALGRPRDLALGIEFVDGEGAVARGGGRVVKNVAGFDLVRLMVGAFGTLGIITEVTVRLRAIPAADVTVLIVPAGGGVRGASPPAGAKWPPAAGSSSIERDAAVADALIAAEVAPSGCAVLDQHDARLLGVPAGAVVARYMGSTALVRAGVAEAGRLGTVTETDGRFWTSYRARDPHPRMLRGSPLSISVARRLKGRFDPGSVLNPGILGEDAE
ncbi:MAG: FAD-binding protein [Gemmatimonadaceae bacterium]|nr:FAD-binding protein [Gemmatimonadaceae bacterium]